VVGIWIVGIVGASNRYEIEFGVPERHREEFEEWLSSNAVEWVSHETVVSFEALRNDTGLSPERKFVFGFETLRDRAVFVSSEEHNRRGAVRKAHGQQGWGPLARHLCQAGAERRFGMRTCDEDDRVSGVLTAAAT